MRVKRFHTRSREQRLVRLLTLVPPTCIYSCSVHWSLWFLSINRESRTTKWSTSVLDEQEKTVHTLKVRPTKPANAKVALDGLKQQHRGVDSHIKSLRAKNIYVSNKKCILHNIHLTCWTRYTLTLIKGAQGMTKLTQRGNSPKTRNSKQKQLAFYILCSFPCLFCWAIVTNEKNLSSLLQGEQLELITGSLELHEV